MSRTKGAKDAKPRKPGSGRWKKDDGKSRNPNGNPLWKIFKFDKTDVTKQKMDELKRRAKEEGLEDPVIILLRLANDPELPKITQGNFASAAARFVHPPAPPALPLKVHYSNTKIDLPHPNPRSLEDFDENIQYLVSLRLKLDRETVDVLISDQQRLFDNAVERAKLTGTDGGPQLIEIVGGLPRLPRTDTIMPRDSLKPFNGAHVDPGKLIDAEVAKDPIEPTTTSPPADPPSTTDPKP
jgi:hypothetical protein